MIYIDPPYNTGKDFIYKDDFSENVNGYLQRSNQRSDDGEQLITNTESNGRYHSDWLTMMYSRLRLSRHLLKNDGVIFLSINHNELSNLKKICDEIFDNQAKFKYCHEYILVNAKNEEDFLSPLLVDPNTPSDSKIFLSEIRNTIIKNGPKNPASNIKLPIGFPCSFARGEIESRSNLWPHFSKTVKVENWHLVESIEVYSGWSSKELLFKYINNNCQPISDLKGQETKFELTQTGAIEAVKKRGATSHVISTLSGLGGPQKAVGEISDLGVIFDDYPKPLSLILYLLKMNRGDDFIVFDFFSGSATTAHAVMELNLEDGGSRQYILVQFPELCNEDSNAFKASYKTIAEIGKERIRRAGKKIKKENADKEGIDQLDIGFRVLKIDNSNMNEVYYSPDALKHTDLFGQVDNIRADRTPEDLLFQVLLDWGVDLTLSIKKEKVAGKEVFFVDGSEQNMALAACFEIDINEEFVKKLATRKPLRVVFRDSGFEDDNVKINVEQIFKLMSPSTDVKVI